MAVLSENDEYDLFIAYYGNSNIGSERAAESLYNVIDGYSIGENRNLRCYFHPITNPYGVFEETPLIVARTPLFILIADQGIPRNPDGQLARLRDDGTLRNLFEEVQTFHNSPMYKEYKGTDSAKLFLTDQYGFREAEQLHPIFSGRVAFTTNQQVISWIQSFYRITYPERLYRKAKYLTLNKTMRAKFLEGDWVQKAEEWWRASHYENLGRILLIYYCEKRNEKPIFLEKAQKCYRELLELPQINAKTRGTLLTLKEPLNQ